MNLKMYGTASEGKHVLIEQLGGIPIDYKSENFVEVVGDAKIDAVFDAIGGDNFKRSFRTLKKGGILVAYGFYNNAMGKGGSIPLEFMKIALWNLLPNGRFTNFYSIGKMRAQNPDWYKEDLGILFELLSKKKIKPVIEKRMKLEDAVEAHKLIENASVKGRLVLEIR